MNRWRINKSLLKDKGVEKRIKKELIQNFLTNESNEVSEARVREAHKTYIRGKLIAISLQKKKEVRKGKYY